MPAQNILDILLSGGQQASQPSLTKPSPKPAQASAPQAPQANQPFGLNDIGEAMRLIMQNPIEFAVPAVLGVPLEKVLLGALQRSRRGSQQKSPASKGKSKSKTEPSILEDILKANESDAAFIDVLLRAFNPGG